jgi:hypothetical protein
MGKQGRLAHEARRTTNLTAATLHGIEAAVHWAVEQGFDHPGLAAALSFFEHVEAVRADAVVLPKLSFVSMLARDHVFESHEATSEYDLGFREGWSAAVGGHLPRVLERELARRGESYAVSSRTQHKTVCGYCGLAGCAAVDGSPCSWAELRAVAS